MFAPEGYIPAKSVFHKFEQLGNLELNLIRAANYAARIDGFTDTGAINGMTLSNTLFSRSAFPYWAIWSLAYDFDTGAYLCAADGRILRASPDFFFGNDLIAFSDFSIYEPGSNMHDLWDSMKKKNISGEAYDRFDDGWFVSTETWCVRSLRDSLKKIPSDLRAVPEITELAKAAARFEGWAICFKRSDIPSDNDDLLEVAENMGAEVRILVSNEYSRSSLRSKAGEAMQELYPLGRGNVSWKEVAREVSRKLGRNVSVKTLTRSERGRQAADSIADTEQD